MLNLGMLYFNSDRGQTVPDVLNAIIVAENPQSLGYRLVDAAGTNFNRMFNFLKIETGDFARLQRHHDDFNRTVEEAGIKETPLLNCPLLFCPDSGSANFCCCSSP